jgi:hypothetical protein
MATDDTPDQSSSNATDAAVAALVARATMSVEAIEQHAHIAAADSAAATAASTAATAANAAATSASAATLESQSQAAAAFADAQAKLNEISAVASLAAAAKVQIHDSQAVIATKSDHIDGAQKHADKVRGDLDRVLTAAQASLTETDGLRARTAALNDTVTTMHAAVTTSKAEVDANTEATRQSLAAARDAAITAKKLAEKADETERRVAEYEARLAELERQSREQLNTITGLLPGATSAGLASAFDERRKTFLIPGNRWQRWFVASILLLIALALTGLIQLYLGTDALTYEKLLRVWLARVPVAAALVWLALYTSREAALAKRLEEDYGYKSAIAASFQGFQKQMQEIATTVGAESPLGKLCHNTLTTIASPPGRIYDKHALTVTPSAEVKELVAALMDAIPKVGGK